MTTTNSTSSASAQAILAGLQRTATASSKTEDSQSRFLTLLTAQLKNQDPLSPMDNAQMTSQLAQISTVDGIERLNATLAGLIDSQQASEALQAASLVGRGVLVPGTKLALSDNGAIGGYTLGAAADKVTLTVKDANGLAVAEVDLGAQEAGTHSFTWDGTSIDGTKAANGTYTISVKATADDSKVTASTLQLGVVSSVVRGASGTDLEVGSLGIFQMSDIMQIL
ncbi:MAG: flagellar hook assembly protein FlgD [Rhodocyclaceae bacterium]|jgi:flagellar basal-body rod modification protein FlgD|nr:flagellar hook assembly protein FlgD [Rhodocyclaceae bacterium]